MICPKSRSGCPTVEPDEVRSSGAPMSFGGAELQSVSFDPIPKEGFKLPANPCRHRVRKR